MKIRAHIVLAAMLVAFLTPGMTLAAKKPAVARKPAVEAPWAPQAFQIDAGQLPARYSGLNPAKTLTLLNGKADVFVKGEYETTQEYETRLASKSTQIAPLSMESDYAFLLADIKATYDADTQSYVIKEYSFCQQAYSFGDSAGWVTCKISTITRKRDAYVGSNAFGASAVIDRTTGKDFGIAIRRDSPFLKSDIFDQTTSSQYSSIFGLKVSIPVPIEKARALARYDIGVLLVGKIASPKLVEGRSVLIEPKISDPTDIFITQDAVPFAPSRLVLFVIQTGEVLSDHPL